MKLRNHELRGQDICITPITRLRDLEAGNSTPSLGSNGNGKPAHRITDFWNYEITNYEICITPIQLQKRLCDLEAGNSTSSLGSDGNGKPAHRITDFWNYEITICEIMNYEICITPITKKIMWPRSW